ncbi:MAG: PAS domain-containing protein [Pseudomonadales bacterium]|nr:PAS domain-containing protein [Pseudomonadales bacterium]
MMNLLKRQSFSLALLILIGASVSIIAQRYVDRIFKTQQQQEVLRLSHILDAEIQDDFLLLQSQIKRLHTELSRHSIAEVRQSWDEKLSLQNEELKYLKALALFDAEKRAVYVFNNDKKNRFSWLPSLTQLSSEDTITWQLIYYDKDKAAMDMLVFSPIKLKRQGEKTLKEPLFLLVKIHLAALIQNNIKLIDAQVFDLLPVVNGTHTPADEKTLNSLDKVGGRKPVATDSPIILPADIHFFNSRFPLKYQFTPAKRPLIFWLYRYSPLLSGLIITLFLFIYQSHLFFLLQGLKSRFNDETKKLISSRQEMDTLINSVHGVLWRYDIKAKRYSFVSDQVEDLLGITAAEILQLQKGALSMVYPDDIAMVKEKFQALRNNVGESQNIEFRMLHKDGSLVWVRNIISNTAENSVVISSTGLMFDITRFKNMAKQQRTMQAQLNQAQKLESIGQLAAGVAHDINTPVQFVYDNTDFLQKAFVDLSRFCQAAMTINTVHDDSTLAALTQSLNTQAKAMDMDFLLEDIPQCIAQSLDGIQRISTIVKALKDFSHPDSEHPEAVDINATILSTVNVSRNEWRFIAEVKTDLAELPSIQGYHSALSQVFLNMIVNAAHAIEQLQSENLGLINIQSFADEKNIFIKISDTGAGIEPEIIDKIYDPFFTTKEVGKGTGQGLSMAYRIIVEQHAGKLDVESHPGEGCCFTISLPI